MTDLDALRKRHRETKNWPLMRNDRRTGPDGYIHTCRTDGEPWPCDAAALLSEVESLRRVRDAAREAADRRYGQLGLADPNLKDLRAALAATEPAEREAQ